MWKPREMLARGQHPPKPLAFICCHGTLIAVAMADEWPRLQELRIHRRHCENRVRNAELAAPWDWVQVRIDPDERSVSYAEIQSRRSQSFVETVRTAREEARRRKEARHTL